MSKIHTSIKMKSFKFLDEAAYAGNIGFEEIVKFYQKANKKEELEMDRAIKKNDFSRFRELIFQVLGVKLK